MPVRDLEDKTAKMRRAVRANNFTQQTNALDVDKHMYGPSPLHSEGAHVINAGWRTLKKI